MTDEDSEDFTVAFRTTIDEADYFSATWQSEIDMASYVDRVDRSMDAWLRHIHRNSLYTDSNLNSSQILSVCRPDFKFRPSVAQVGPDAIEIKITRGVYLAIQDLAFRATSSQNFFNPQVGEIEYESRWRGAKCRAPIVTLPPKHRYYDYSPNPSAIQQPAIDFKAHCDREGISPSWIGLVVRKLPFDDERLSLALAVMEVALHWIVLHEESHYREGHLQYLAHARRKRQTFAEADATDSLYSEETCSVFEWQADRGAAIAICDIFFKQSWSELLPAYARQDWSWVLRFLMTSVGVALVAIDRCRQINGVRQGYPPPRLRLLAMFRVISGMIYKRPRDLFNVIDPRHTARSVAEKLAQHEGPLLKGWEQDHHRMQGALTGSLWDLTQLQQLIRDEDDVSDMDRLWPLEDYAPFAMATPLYWMGTNLGDVPSFVKQMEEFVLPLHRAAVVDFKTTQTEMQSLHELAKRWSEELNQLIEISDRKYRPLTRDWRRWDIDEL